MAIVPTGAIVPTSAILAQQPAWSPQPFVADNSMKPLSQAPQQNSAGTADSKQIKNPLRPSSAERASSENAQPAVVARFKQSTLSKAADMKRRMDQPQAEVASATYERAQNAPAPSVPVNRFRTSGVASNNKSSNDRVTLAQFDAPQDRNLGGGLPPLPERGRGRQEQEDPRNMRMEPPEKIDPGMEDGPQLQLGNEPQQDPVQDNQVQDDPKLNDENAVEDPNMDPPEEAPIPPRANPFGKTERRTPPVDDQEEDTQIRSSRPLQRQTDFRIDCDKMREKALGDDITKISLDVSPAFGVGIGSGESAEAKRQRFAETAKSRSWRDYQGQFIIDAKLIDLKKDHVILETASGTTQKYRVDRLSDPDLVYLSEVWGIPVTCTLGYQPDKGRAFTPIIAEWTASNLCHKPLYFEDVQLERYGHEIGPVMQPLKSSAHFFGNIAVLPYKMGIHPMHECQYSLGYYRPGNCAPWTVGPVPISLRGALNQAGVVTGFAGLVP